jgi:hypothetical protein
MRTWILLAALAVVVAAAATATAGYEARALPSSAQDCGDWGNQTADRVETARLLLYPPERQGQSTGSAQGDAQALAALAQEQANSNPPDEGLNLSNDLIEAFSAGASALAGGQGGSPDAQVAFAKAIVYNADLRVNYLLDGC